MILPLQIALGGFALSDTLEYKIFYRSLFSAKKADSIVLRNPSLPKKIINSAEFINNRTHHTQNLKSLNKGAENNLISVQTVFPFVMFADTLKIDRQKITIVHNDFFWSSQTTSIKLKDLRNVEADIGVLFGSITITSNNFLNNTQTIKFLKRTDVVNIQRLLQGFMIAHDANVDTDHIEQRELINTLYKLGQENIG